MDELTPEQLRWVDWGARNALETVKGFIEGRLVIRREMMELEGEMAEREASFREGQASPPTTASPITGSGSDAQAPESTGAPTPASPPSETGPASSAASGSECAHEWLVTILWWDGKPQHVAYCETCLALRWYGPPSVEEQGPVSERWS